MVIRIASRFPQTLYPFIVLSVNLRLLNRIKLRASTKILEEIDTKFWIVCSPNDCTVEELPVRSRLKFLNFFGDGVDLMSEGLVALSGAVFLFGCGGGVSSIYACYDWR